MPTTTRSPRTLAERLREMFPGAELPRLPGEPRSRRRAARAARRRRDAEASTARRAAAAGAGSRPRRRGCSWCWRSAAVLLIAVVLAITGAFGGDDDEPRRPPTETTTERRAPATRRSSGSTLRATGGGNASGEALFGLATGDQPFVEVSIEGLDPAPQGQQYVIWLMLTADQGYPLSPISVSQQGTYSNRFPIPSAVLPVVARVRFVDVSIAPANEIRRVVQRALQDSSLVLDKPGRDGASGHDPPAAAEQPPG